MTMTDFLARWATLRPGETLVYHVGHLAYDTRRNRDLRALHRHVLTLGTPAGQPILIQDEARKQRPMPRGTGEAALAQRRVDEGVYEYIAVKLERRLE